MYSYRFNVSHYGKHLFRTDWQSSMTDAKHTARELVAKFPAEQGYRVDQYRRSDLMTRVALTGAQLED